MGSRGSRREKFVFQQFAQQVDQGDVTLLDAFGRVRRDGEHFVGHLAQAPAAAAGHRDHQDVQDDAQQERAVIERSGSTLPGVQQYSQAYERYAELRYQRAAYLDSAASARSEGDRARFTRSAQGFATRAPNVGSMLANVSREHTRELEARRAERSHACYRIVE